MLKLFEHALCLQNPQCFQGRSENATTRFLLSDQCYATAELERTDAVNLWLGVRLFVWFYLNLKAEPEQIEKSRIIFVSRS